MVGPSIGQTSSMLLRRRAFCTLRNDLPLVELKDARLRPFRAPGSSLFFAARRLARGEADVEDVQSSKLEYLVNGVNWCIRPGESWLVVGGNGVGKSCLVQGLCGKSQVVGGQVRYREDVSPRDFAYLSVKADQALKELARKVAELGSWDAHQDEDLGVERLLSRSAQDSRTKATALEQREIVDALGVSGLGNKHLDVLSTGQLRLLSVAQALMRRPKVCVLDEPFDGLDTDARDALATFLGALSKQGWQFVVVSHRLSEVQTLGFITHVLEIGPESTITQCGERDSVTTSSALGRLDWSARHSTDFPEVNPSLLAAALSNCPKIKRSSSPLIDMKNIKIKFSGSDPLVTGLNWTVVAGQHWNVRGPNGVGKSVLLGMITGHTAQAYGNDVQLFGLPKAKWSIEALRGRIGQVSAQVQTQLQQNHQSALKTICTGFHGIVGGACPPCSEAQYEQARRWAAVLGLEPLLDRSFTALSQGQQRLVVVARALVTGHRQGNLPDILLLDEPFHGLDTFRRRMLIDTLEQVSSYATIILVTHHEDEVPGFLSNVLKLEKHEA